eukprot:TRINITY_DN12129_c0_g1_i1.p1 TRINITY_DN12129_c0_g1~~TRINITY_DN12129_c0_g1_i1.p1  ORF type:complete len:494 (-),score=50.09 TRINITY_DN12129_c0_g1_i1:119-1483(-)
METYQLTQEDETLAAVHRMNAVRARRRQHHAGVHDAQRRASRLAISVARYELSLPGLHQAADAAPGRRSETRSHSCSAALGRSGNDVSLEEDGQPCSTQQDLSPSMDADVSRRPSVRRSTVPAKFWNWDSHAGARVAPSSDASEVQSPSGQKGRFPQSRTVLRKLSSMIRRTNQEEQNQKTQFDSPRHDARLDSSSSTTSRGMSNDIGDEPTHASVRDAQPRAARRANSVAKYEVSSPDMSDDESQKRSQVAEVKSGRRSETRSHSCSAALGRSGNDVSLEEDGQPCSTQQDISPSIDADVSRRPSVRRSTVPAKFWKGDSRAGARVAPTSDASEVQSPSGQGRPSLSSAVLRKLRSMIRRPNQEKQNQKTQFDSLFHVSSSGNGGGHLDSSSSTTSRGTSYDIGDESTQAGKEDALCGRSKSSLMCALRKGMSGFKAADKKQRASPSAEVWLA